MEWDGYTVFSVISGVALLITGLAVRGSAKQRLGCIAGGVFIAGYGIYVANQTSGTYFFPVQIFVVPFLLAGLVIFSVVRRGQSSRPAAAGSHQPGTPGPADVPQARPDQTARPDRAAAAVPGKVRVPGELAVPNHEYVPDGSPRGGAAPGSERDWQGAAGEHVTTTPGGAVPPAIGASPAPPGSVIEMVCGASTDVGRVRQMNEDSFVGYPPVFLVADGMGGHEAGDVASAIVAEEFSAPVASTSVTPEWVLDRFARAEARIRGGVAGGTTVSGAAVVRQDGQPYWLVFNVGDSRVYHCADGEVNQVTVDHSVVQELVDAGEVAPERARFHPQRHVITRAVGSPDSLRPDFWLLPMSGGDRLMICSDGLTSELDDVRVRDLVVRPAPPQDTADALVAAAVAAGGRDNVTAVVVDVISIGSRPSTGAVAESSTHRRLLDADDAEHTTPRLRSTPAPGGAR